MNRRTFLKCAVSTALATALAPGQFAAAAPNRPNIVLILADDLGYGDLSCQNPDSKIPTPNIDRLASQGMRFTDAHSPSAVCSPTRYGLLTGTYAWRTELKKSVLWPWDRPLIDANTLTLPAMLKGLGYETACIGKWHLGWEWASDDGSSVNDVEPIGVYNGTSREEWAKAHLDLSKPIAGGPITRGFDYYFGDDVPNFPPYCFIENERLLGDPADYHPGLPFSRPGPAVPGWQFDAVMPALTEKAVEYIAAGPGEGLFGRTADGPFFLYFPLTAPHTPIAPAQGFIGKSGAHRYGDYVNEVDWTVGRVLDALEASGQAENTLVIFTSDNGSPARDGTDMNGAPSSVLAYGHNPSHIYRGIKTNIWDGGHHVPFIAKWPGHIAAGETSNALLGLNDMMATLAAITGAALPVDAARDSVDVSNALLRHGAGRTESEPLVHHSGNGVFAIRKGSWKFIDGPGNGGWGDKPPADAPRVQLYNMVDDPSETRNVYAERPEVVRELAGILNGVRDSARTAVR